jgi:hypothetical protein
MASSGWHRADGIERMASSGWYRADGIERMASSGWYQLAFRGTLIASSSGLYLAVSASPVAMFDRRLGYETSQSYVGPDRRHASVHDSTEDG